MLGREHERYGSGIGPADEDGSLHLCGVHDRQDVWDHLFHGSDRRAIGETGASLVEEHDPSHAGETLDEMANLRQLPDDLEMGDPADHQHYVEGPVPHHLVGDVDVSGPYESRFGNQLGQVAGRVLMGSLAANRMSVSQRGIPSLI